MTSHIPTLEQIRARLAGAVATAKKRTPEEQKSLIAGLLAELLEARRNSSATV